MRFIFVILLVAASVFAAERTVLFEDHTNAQCGPCWTIEPQINAFVNSHLAVGDLAVLRTHAWWPGNDPIYNANPTEQKSRIEFYNISGVPALKMDGILPAGGTNLEARFDIRAATPCYLNIDVSKSGTDEDGTIFIALTAEQQLTSQIIKLQAILVEDEVPGTGYWSSTVFEQAFRDNIVSTNGQVIDFGSTYPSTLYFDYAFSTTGFVEENMSLVVFVQNASNKEVYNAYYQSVSDIPLNTGIEGSSAAELTISVTPSPSTGTFSVAHSGSENTSGSLTLFDLSGRQVETAVVSGIQTQFSVSNPGVYLVVMNSEDGRTASRRIVVTR